MMMFWMGFGLGLTVGMAVLLVHTVKQTNQNNKKFIARLERRHEKG